MKSWTLIITALIGLTGALKLVIGDQIQLAIFIALVALVLAYFAINSYKYKNFPLTLIHTELSLDFSKNNDAKSALVAKKQKLRPNTKHGGMYREEIWTEGRIENLIVKLDGNSIPIERWNEGKSPTEQNSACLYLCVFDPPLEKGKEYIREVGYSLFESFPGKKECYIHLVNYKEKKVSFKFIFPKERTPITFKVYEVTRGVVYKHLSDLRPSLEQNQKAVYTYVVKTLPLGGSIRFIWEHRQEGRKEVENQAVNCYNDNKS